jgi:hypothetical protein
MVGRFAVRVFRQFSSLKLVSSKERYLVPLRWIDWRSRVEITSVWGRPQAGGQPI